MDRKRPDATLLKSFAEVGADLFAQQLISATAGNFSVRDGDGLWITRSGVRKNRLRAEDVIWVPMAPDAELDRGASIELILHRAVYARTDARALVHAHPRTAVALSFFERVIRPVDLEGRTFLGEVPVLAPRSVSASPEAAEALAEGLLQAPVVILRGHGAFARGDDLFQAYARLTVLEESTQILLSAKLYGDRSEP